MKDKQRQYSPGGGGEIMVEINGDATVWFEAPANEYGLKYYCAKCKVMRNEITRYCPWCGRKALNVYEGETDNQPENLHTGGDRTK